MVEKSNYNIFENRTPIKLFKKAFSTHVWLMLLH